MSRKRLIIAFILALMFSSCSLPREPLRSTITPISTQQVLMSMPTATQTIAQQSQPTPAISIPTEFYVAPTGSSTGDGSLLHPWDLQTALNHPNVVQPGDTIWLRGGQYSGQYISHLKGALNYPITIRQYPGERATLIAHGKVLIISDSYWVNFWGFEITSFDHNREQRDGVSWEDGIRVDQGESSHHIRFINLIVHDMQAQGFAWWETNSDSEIYGSLIYYNGVNQFDHGIYVKNGEGEKKIVDNFIFDNANHGIHAYSSRNSPPDNIHLDNLQLVGNTVFNNGSIGFNPRTNKYGEFVQNILIGGVSVVAHNPIIDQNNSYFPGDVGTVLNLGYRKGSLNAMITNNILSGGELEFGGSNDEVTMINNQVLVFTVKGFTSSEYPDNSWLSSKPQSPQIIIRPNKYEVGRANITIFNWDKQEIVIVSDADLAKVSLNKGDYYELHNVQDYFGDIISGTYDGIAITIPMTNRSVAQPVGLDFLPPSTFPQFGGFVLITSKKP